MKVLKIHLKKKLPIRTAALFPNPITRVKI